jgi:hypothetical protein
VIDDDHSVGRGTAHDALGNIVADQRVRSTCGNVRKE